MSKTNKSLLPSSPSLFTGEGGRGSTRLYYSNNGDTANDMPEAKAEGRAFAYHPQQGDSRHISAFRGCGA